MPFMVAMRLEGEPRLRAAFETLKRSLQKKHLRKAMNKVGKDVLWAARARTPRRSGTLYKSLGRKVKTYKSGIVVAIVGARKGFATTYGTRLRDSRPTTKSWNRYRAGEAIRVNPAKYLHLVELGTKRSAGRHMLRDAYREAKAKLEGYLNEAMNAAIAEAAAKGGR